LVEVTHNASNALNNVQIKCKMPQGLKFKSTDKNGIYDESTDTTTWNFEKLNSELFFISSNKIIISKLSSHPNLSKEAA